MAVTPFLKLQKPPFDTIPWDQAINGNMDTIDAFIQRYMAVPNYVGSWANSTAYVSGQNVLDITNATIYLCQVTHTSSATPATFAQDRSTYPTYWAATTNVVSGSTALTVGEATPLSSKAGDLWWNSAEGQLYVMYNDGNSLQWVIANNTTGMMGEAPNDGNIYGRQRSAWTPVIPGGAGSVGRNLIHNPLFNIAQRGTGPWTTLNYTADRWKVANSLDTISANWSAASDAIRAAVSDEAATSILQVIFTGNAGATSYTVLFQPIENVRRLAGKTVIVSFYAYSSAATKIGVSIDQSFGTGGSPSAFVTNNGQAATTSTTWGRYSVTLSVPSVIGKITGTNGDDFSQVNIWLSTGSSANPRSGSIGVQAATVQLWGVQLEIAAPGQTQPTPLEKPDPELQLRQCQRFYQTGNVGINTVSAGGWTHQYMCSLPVTMRATPAMTSNFGTQTGCSGSTVLALSSAAYQLQTGTAGSGGFTCLGNFTASADL